MRFALRLALAALILTGMLAVSGCGLAATLLGGKKKKDKPFLLTNAEPGVYVAPISGSYDNQITVTYLVTDPDGNPVDLVLEYSTDGATWQGASGATSSPLHDGVSNLTASPSGEIYRFVWDTITDIPGSNEPACSVRLTVTDIPGPTLDPMTSLPAQAGPFAVFNNTGPRIDITSPVGGDNADTVTGSVLVVYDIYDAEFNNVSVTVQFSVDGGINFGNCTESADIVDSHASEGLDNLTSNSGGFEHYFVWDTGVDVGQALETNVKLRITCHDEDTGTPDETAAFIVDNNKPPAVINVVSPPDNVGGTFPIQFTIADNASDAARIEAWVSLDGGNNYDFQIVPAAGSPPTDGLATSPAGRNHYLLWDSETFVQGVVESAVRIRVDVWDITQGCSGYTNVFIVNNDPNQTTPTPPLVSIVTPLTQQSDDVHISYTLYDAQSDAADIWVQYSLNGGQSFFNATEFTGMGDGVTGLTTSPTGVSHTVVWDSKADMGTISSNQVVIKITPSDLLAGQGGAAQTDEFTVNNNAVSLALVTTPTVGLFGNISIDYSLVDADNDLLDIIVQWSTDGLNFENASEGSGGDGMTSLESSAAGYPHMFSWDSLADTGKQNLSGVIIRIIPYDANGFGIEGDTGTFTVSNNEPPVVTALTDPGQNSGNITIQYTLADSFSHPASISIEFTNDSGTSWYPCTEQTGISEGKVNLTTSPAGIPHFFIWNSTAPSDIGSGPGAVATVQVRIIPSDDDVGDNKNTSYFTIDNTNITNKEPSVAISQPNVVTMDTAIFYQLADQESDLVGIIIEYSTDGSNYDNCTESATAFSQGTSGLTTTPVGRNHVFVWDTFTDIGPTTESNVRIRIIPFDTSIGCSFTTGPFTVRNNDAPAVSVITPGGIQTDDVPLQYTIVDTNSDPASIWVAYSPDAGQTWFAATQGTGGNGTSGLTTSPAGNSYTFVWDSRADLGDVHLSSVRLRVIAADSEPGPAAATSVFTVNNNTPPTAIITTPSATMSGDITIDYILSDSVQDNVSVLAQFKIGAGPWTNAMATAGSEPISWIPASPTGVAHYFIWDSVLNLGSFETGNVYFRILPYDADTGNASMIGPFLVDNNDVPVVFITAPAATVSGLVDIEYALYDNNSDTIDVYPQYSTDGLNWYDATRNISGGDGTTGLVSAPFPTANTYYFRWDTLVDIGEAYISSVYFRIRPYDSNAGEFDETGPFTVNNNTLPAVTVSTPSSPQVDGTAVISYRIFDNACDTCNIFVEFSNDSGTTWFACTEDAISPYHQGTSGLSSRSTIEGGAVHLFAWNSLADAVGNSGIQTVTVRVRAHDGQDNGSWGECTPFDVDNTGFAGASPPIVSVVNLTGVLSGDVLLRYTLTDSQSDLVEIVVEYSVEGGAFQNATERPGSPSHGTTNLASASFPVNHVFVWDSVIDLGNTNSNDVVLRITPSDVGSGAGTPDNSNSFALYNNAPPEIVILPLTAIGGNAAISFNIYDATGDNVSATVFYSTDGGTIFLPAKLGLPGGNYSLTSAPGGVTHAIYWDSNADLPAANTPGVILKMVPYDDYGTGPEAESVPFMVSNVGAVNTVVILPGQTWTEGVGISGIPDSQTAGVPFEIQVRVVDAAMSGTAFAHSDTLDITTDDPNDIEPGSESFDNGVATFTVTNVTADINRTITPNSFLIDNVSGNYVVKPGTATQIVVVLPGQTLVQGVAVTGSPADEHIGIPLVGSVGIYAVDDNFNIDPTDNTSVLVNSSDVSATVADLNGVNPGHITLTSGSGVLDNAASDFVFNIPGAHVIYAHDVSGGGLLSATSDSVQVVDMLTFFGNVSSDWNVHDNWSPPIIPSSFSNVVISKDALNNAALISSVSVASLTVEDSGTLDMNGQTLVVHGDVSLDCGGTLDASGTDMYLGGAFNYDPLAVLTADAVTIVHFNRSGTQVLPTGVPFTNVYVECPVAELGGVFNATILSIRSGSEVVLTSDSYIDSRVEILGGGKLRGVGRTLTVTNDWTAAGGDYLYDNASTVVFEASALITISGPEQFNHLTLDGTGSLRFSGSTTVDGNLIVQNGILRIGSGTLQLRGDLTVTDSVQNTGGILRFDGGGDQKWTGTPASEDFGNVEIDKPAGTVSLMRPVSLSNTSLISGTFDPGPYNHVLGGFSISGGNLVMDSDSDVLNCSDVTVSGGDTTGVSAGKLLISGNLDITAPGSFTPSGGTVEFNGSSAQAWQASGNNFGDVVVSGGSLSANTPLIINGDLEVAGTASLSIGDDLTIDNVCDIAGVLSMFSNCILSADVFAVDGELTFDGTLAVGSLLQVTGKLKSMTSDELITSRDILTPTRYAFTVSTTADLDIVGTKITYTDANGLRMLGLPTFTTFSTLVFENAVTGGNHLSIIADGDLTAVWNFFSFDGTFIPGGHNISLQANGHSVEITMVNFSGAGAGEQYDEETGGGLVLWSGRPSVEITPIVTEQGVLVTIDYTLIDADGDDCTIYPEYSPDGGNSWFGPNMAGGDGTTSLTASGAGTSHTYVWNAVLDLDAVDIDTVRFRITPADGGGNGTSDETSDFHVDANDIPAAAFHGQIVPLRLPVDASPIPGKRRGHTLTYDPVRGRLIMIGGAAGAFGCGGYVTDVWEFDMDLMGSPWRRIYPGGAGFTSRARHTAVFDEVSNRIIVCGGENNASAEMPIALDFNSDPENGTWIELDPIGVGPENRIGHSAVYDSVNARMILFGGYKNPTRYDDAWELDLSSGGNGSWTQLVPGGDVITARNNHVAVYDRPSQRMIVYGGYDGTSYLNQVWSLSLAGGGDGSWQKLSPGGTPPEGRILTGAAYDPFQRRMIIIGGSPDCSAVTDSVSTLSIKPGGVTWQSTILDAFNPTPVHSLAAAYLPRSSAFVTFGGQADGGVIIEETVAYSVARNGASEWQFVEETGIAPGIFTRSAMVYDPVGTRLLVIGGWVAGTNASNGVWEYDIESAAWQQLSPGGSFTARYAHSAVYDGKRRRIIAFGGLNSTDTPLDSIDILDISSGGSGTWIPTSPSGSLPEARYGHVAAFDTAGDRMVVFGGTNGSDFFTETAFLDFSCSAMGAWQSLGILGPGVQNDMVAVYNPYRKEMILVANSAFPAETWILELSPKGLEFWSNIPTGGDLLPRLAGATAAFMPQQEGMVLFGGRNLDTLEFENRMYAFYYNGPGGDDVWVELETNGSAPPPRLGAAAAFVPEREQFVAFGGDSGAGVFGSDAWVRSISGNLPNSILRGNATIFPRIYDPEEDNVSVTIEYSPSGGAPGTWLAVTLAPGSDSLDNVEARSFGSMMAYDWDTIADFGTSTVTDVYLRIRAADNDTGSWAVRGPFRIDNEEPSVSSITQRLDLDPSGHTVDILFSEKVDQATAERLANYSVSGKTVISVVLLADGMTVRIVFLERIVPGTDTISVSGVCDLAGNPVDGPAHTDMPVGSTDTTPPQLVSAFWYDYNNTGFVDEEDIILLYFDSVVQVYDCSTDRYAADPGAFTFPVSGDSIGDNVYVTDAYPNDDWVALFLGGGPSLNVTGTYDPADNSFGMPSGIEIGSAINDIIQDLAGNDAVPGAAYDIEGQVLGEVQMDILNSDGLKLLGKTKGRFDIFCVTQSDWVSMGLAGGSDPRHFQAFRRGVEIPLMIIDNDDNSWDPGDEMYVLMPGHADLYSVYDVVYLVNSPAVSQGLRFQDVSGAPSGSCASATMFLASESERPLNEFCARFYPYPEDLNPWLGSYTTHSSGNSTHHFRAGFVAPAGGCASMTFTFYGVDDPTWPNTPHRVVGYLNGVQIFDDNSSSGYGFFSVTAEFPSGLIVSDNENNIDITAPGVVGVDAVYLNEFGVGYNSSFIAREGGNYLFFTCVEEGDYQITGFVGTGDGMVIWDLTNTSNPKNVVYWDFDCGTLTINHSGAPKTYVAGYIGGVQPPAFANINPPSLRNTSMAANYVIITEESMMPAALNMKSHRKSGFGGGYQVEIVDIGQIYDEFRFGYESADAVRMFLNYAHFNWSVSPQYVLLLGDSTLDLDNGEDTGRRNIIPTRWRRIDDSLPWISSDYDIADCTGSDYKADVRIGRLPAGDLGNANLLVQKTIDYECQSNSGTWENAVLQISDEKDLMWDYPLYSSQLMSYLGGYTVTYLEAPMNADSITVGNAMNSGQLFVCHFGLGDMTQLGQPPVWDTWDVPGLNNMGNYSILLTGHNISGFFMDRHDDCLLEAMLTHGTGGSVAGVAPAVQLNDFQIEYMYFDEFYNRYFFAAEDTLGYIDAAARAYVLDSGVDMETYRLSRSYMLLGDPALKIK
ncbi:MAG: Kelch repeat-containing protein [Planctomycetota bacterium]|jgi:hypothetical protein